MTTSNQIGYAGMIGAVAGAFSSYEAGKQRQLAYEHEAAMSEINAQQVKIQGMFKIADMTEALTDNLALQAVMAAASGRVANVGSTKNLTDTSISNYEKDKERVKSTGNARSVSLMMDGASKRAAGSSAKTMGLLNGVAGATQGYAQYRGYIS